MAAQVPLVIYMFGKRYEIGKASVSDDGLITAQVSSDHWPIVKDYLTPDLSVCSILPVHKDRLLTEYDKFLNTPKK